MPDMSGIGHELSSQLSPFDASVRAFDLCPTPEKITAFKEAAMRFQQKKPRHIVLSAHGKIGSGHINQGIHIENTLRLVSEEQAPDGSLPDRSDVTHWSLDLLGSETSSQDKFWINLYAAMQKNPKVDFFLSSILKHVNIGFVHGMIDSKETEAGKRFFESYMKELIDSPADQPIIFHTTHTIPTELAIALASELERRGREAHVIEYIPDPAFVIGNYAHIMTSNSHFKNHITVVHDNRTAEKLAKIRPGTPVYGLGTLSNPFLSGLYENPHNIVDDGTRRELYLCPGNPRPKFNEAVAKRIEVLKEDIKNGRVRITIHAMHHKSNVDFFNSIKEKYELNDNLEIVYINADTPNALFEAVRQREDLKNQITAYKNVFIGVTGGEQVLEKNANSHVVGVLAGGGHEAENTKRAVEDKQAIDFRNINPSEWTRLIELAQRNDKPNRRTGLAGLATALIQEPHLGKQWGYYIPRTESIPQRARLLDYLGNRWKEAYDEQEELEEEMLSEMRLTRSEFAQKAGERTAFVYIAGGKATRFQKDANEGIVRGKADAQKIMEILRNQGFEMNNGTIDSRALTPLPNFLSDIEVDTVPTFVYSLFQIREFLQNGGENLIVVCSNDFHRQKMTQGLRLLGLDPEKIKFTEQKIYPGRSKVAGHGDALKQIVDAGLVDGYTNMITLFNGEVHSGATIRRSLVAFEYARFKNHELHGLIPAAHINKEKQEGRPGPKYPIEIDEETGIPTGNFVQPKLQGVTNKVISGLSNVGLRIYNVPTILKVLRHPDIQERNYGYFKGQSENENEFALDHLDEFLASGGIIEYKIPPRRNYTSSIHSYSNEEKRAYRVSVDEQDPKNSKVRVFAIADEDEILNSIKSPLDIPGHIQRLLSVLKRNNIKVNPLALIHAKELYEEFGMSLD